MTEPREPRSEILRLLRYHGSLSIDDLAERLGLSKTATRAHALRLERDGLVHRAHPRTSGPGRPPLHFELTTDGADTFPRNESELLRRLLAHLLERGERDTVEDFFAQIWRERSDRFACAKIGDSLDDRLSALEQVLADDGFMPRLHVDEAIDGRRLVVVRECNCPLPSALRATRIPCELEGRFLAESVGGELASRSLASDRSETCEFRFQVADR